MIQETDVQSFRNNGYLVIEDLIPARKIGRFWQEYEQLLSRLYRQWTRDGLVPGLGPSATAKEMLDQCQGRDFDWYQPLDISLPHDGITEDTPMHFGPAVFDIITERRLLDVMEMLLGPEIISNPIQHVRIKPPQRALAADDTRAHVGATYWHQDRGVGLPEADGSDIVTVWLALTDATIENGCLQILPKRPEELLPHCPKGQMTIADGFIDKAAAMPVPVRAGSVILMDPLMPHSSLPNLSEGYRWSLDLRYNVKGQPTGRRQFPDFVVRSKSDPSSALRDWREWRDMWEGTRRFLAGVEHRPQHRWSGDSPHCA